MNKNKRINKNVIQNTLKIKAKQTENKRFFPFYKERSQRKKGRHMYKEVGKGDKRWC